MRLLVWSIVALLAAFSATGVLILVREMARQRRARPVTAEVPGSRFDRYIGPIDRRSAPLAPPLRVTAEFLGALCGFPGLGWMVSGRIRIGLPLVLVVPSAMWAFFPLYVSYTGTLYAEPLRVFIVLPLIAVASALALGVCEMRTATVA